MVQTLLLPFVLLNRLICARLIWDNREFAQELLEPFDGRFAVHKWVAPPAKNDVGWLHRATGGELRCVEPSGCALPKGHQLLQPLCIPLLSVLLPPDDDDKLILVMKLMWQHDRPRFDTFGEVMEFSRQAFERLQRVQYNDGRTASFPSRIPSSISRHETPTHYTRTQRPVKYYIIDFGLSRKFQEGEVPRTYIIEGGDSSPPEFGTIQERLDSAIPHKLLDSFPTDIYYLGNMIRRNYLDGVPVLRQTAKFGFAFMRPLVSDMVQDDPAKRPTIDEVVARFDEIRAGLSSWKLRSDSPPTLAFLKVKSNRLMAVSQLSHHRKLNNFTIYIAAIKMLDEGDIHRQRAPGGEEGMSVWFVGSMGRSRVWMGRSGGCASASAPEQRG
ncbi:hypothetical protein DFH09DRAFT_1103500 [Mycena vulgaris]|nr:hypothetical protein DFH09DRAFT_1103500 [Mycena vulgaris]